MIIYQVWIHSKKIRYCVGGHHDFGFILESLKHFITGYTSNKFSLQHEEKKRVERQAVQWKVNVNWQQNIFKISIVSSNRTTYLSMRYVSATRSVVLLARDTWCYKTNTDWRLRTDDLVSERFIYKAGSVSRRLSKWTVYTYSDFSTCTWLFVLFNKRVRGDARPRDCSREKRHQMVNRWTAWKGWHLWKKSKC